MNLTDPKELTVEKIFNLTIDINVIDPWYHKMIVHKSG
jgi:hypothetical protein